MQAVRERRGGGDQAGEEVVVADLPGPGPDLLDRGPDLPDGGDVAVAGLGGQGLPHLLQGRLDRAQPGGDVAPGVLALGRHQVEDRPDLLCLPADHADPGRGDVRLVELDLQAEPLQHGLLRGVLALVARRGGVQRGDGAAQVGGLVGEAVGGVVAPGVVVAGDPEVGRGLRVALHALVHERVGDGIDRPGSSSIAGLAGMSLSVGAAAPAASGQIDRVDDGCRPVIGCTRPIGADLGRICRRAPGPRSTTCRRPTCSRC